MSARHGIAALLPLAMASPVVPPRDEIVVVISCDASNWFEAMTAAMRALTSAFGYVGSEFAAFHEAIKAALPLTLTSSDEWLALPIRRQLRSVSGGRPIFRPIVVRRWLRVFLAVQPALLPKR